WDVLAELGYDTTGLYLGLGIGTYSELSHAKAVQFAAQRGLPLRVVALEDEAAGLAVPAVAAATRRPPCSACGTMKRHYFDAAAPPSLYKGARTRVEAARPATKLALV